MSLINISNHPYVQWPESMKEAAKKYGGVIDLPMPNVAPNASRDEVKRLASDLLEKVSAIDDPIRVVLIQGEMSLTFSTVSLFKKAGYKCLCSTSERISHIDENGDRIIRFNFCQFREY